jgi:MFS family permease
MDAGTASGDTRPVAAAGGVRERDLRVLSVAIGLSAIGDGVALIALALQAKNLAGEGMGGGVAIAAIFICLWAPVVLLSGHVGLLVDRLETRGLLVAVSLAQAVVAVALAVVGSLAALLGLAAALGAGIAVAQAAEFALVPVVAGDRALQRANGLVETARSLGLAVGPVCGSLLVALGGTAAAMSVDAVSFVVVALAALSLAARRVPEHAAAGERRRARDGIGFLLGDPLVGLMVVVVFVSLLFMSASIPADLVYVEDVLGIRDVGIGVVLSAWTLGMLVGANVVARRVALGSLAAATFVGVTVQGLGKFVSPFWLVFAFMLVCYFVGGIGHGLKNVTSRTLIHTRIPSDRHGRAFAAWNGVRNAAELGALAVGGLVVGLIGARPTLWLAGGLSALAGIAGLAVLSAWRDRVPEPEPDVGTIGSP